MNPVVSAAVDEITKLAKRYVALEGRISQLESRLARAEENIRNLANRPNPWDKIG